MKAIARLGLLLLAAPLAVRAQSPPLKLPQASPEASVTQMVGITEIEIRYHRPAVNKRKVWGELVPWGQVWRAGANENTTISVSSPVAVEGQKLAAGTYGLHMIPTETEWTVIFSAMADAWGSFGYDQKEDVLRVKVQPEKTAFTERLEYTFVNPTDDSVTARLSWDELAVPIRFTVDTPQAVVESLRTQLRGLPQFFWQPWNQAANYCLQKGVDLPEAMQWADRSIAIQENFTNLRTKAGLLEKQGDVKAAEALRAKSLTIATEADMNNYGYQLLGEKKYDAAIAVFQKNVKNYPKSWNAYDSLGEGYLTRGDKKQAAEYYGKALAMTTNESQKKRISEILARLKA
jgi:TolA-binding protein